MTLWIAIICALVVANGFQQRDLYPKVHILLAEAEAASAQVQAFSDRSVPSEWAGHLYARAGYLTDAERAFRHSPRVPIPLLKAYVLYGDMPAAEKMISGIANPEQRATAQLTVADVLWRMGQSATAEAYIERAKKTAARIQDQARRARLISSATQAAQYMSDPPPNVLSPLPQPPANRNPAHSVFPSFPITADGLGDKTAAQREQQAESNQALLETLYARISTGDVEGLRHLLDTVSDPFQKTLVLAGIEHLLIQANQPEEAEQIAVQMPDLGDECLLAKAEALSAVAAAWLRAGSSDRANAAFASATHIAQSVSASPIGQVTVLSSIAEAQSQGGLAATSQETLKAAEVIADRLPVRPEISAGKTWPRRPLHDRPEAYREIFRVAIRAHDLGRARQVAALWRQTGPNNDDGIVQAWCQADETDEAIAFARGIPNRSERAATELWLAQILLDQAGAPNI